MTALKDELRKLHYPCRRGKGCHCEKLIDQATLAIKELMLTEEEIVAIFVGIRGRYDTVDLATAIHKAQEEKIK